MKRLYQVIQEQAKRSRYSIDELLEALDHLPFEHLKAIHNITSITRGMEGEEIFVSEFIQFFSELR